MLTTCLPLHGTSSASVALAASQLSHLGAVAGVTSQPCYGFPEMTSAPDLLVRRQIADELDRIRDTLEELGVELCGDPLIVRGHFNVLQKIDELCQRNQNLARTLRADDMVAACGRITLESLRSRMHGALRAG